MRMRPVVIIAHLRGVNVSGAEATAEPVEVMVIKIKNTNLRTYASFTSHIYCLITINQIDSFWIVHRT